MIGLAVRTKLAAMMELAGMLVQPFGLMIGMLAALPEVSAELAGMIELDETAGPARAQRVELLHCTALVGQSALAELAEILEPIELLELTALLTELLGPVEPVGALAGLAGLVQPAEPLGPVELTVPMVGLLAGLVGRPYSRR